MGKRLDISGQIYGRLLVLIMDWYKTNLTGRTHWFCQCEDNNIVSVQLSSLRNGSTKSCGCLNRELASERRKNSREDLTGQLFTRWFVKSYNPKKSKEMGKPYYNVICTYDGNKGCVSADDLRWNKTKSCGCLRNEMLSEKCKNQIGENNPNWKEKEIIICKQCGKEKEVIPSRENTAQFCDIECYSKWQSENLQGEHSPAWKGGITPFYQIIRTSKEYKEFIKQILKKAKYTCQVSKEVGGELNVHHKKGFAKILKENNITTKEQAFECEELWDESNIIVLSEKWHSGIKSDNPYAFHRLYSVRSFTEQDFYEWFNKFSKVS